MVLKQFTKEEIGAIFAKLRKAARLTQGDVAQRLDTTAQTISRWEKGENQPDLNTFFNLCAIYEADISLEFGLREATDSHGKHVEDTRLDEINVHFYELIPEAQKRAYQTFNDIYCNPNNRYDHDWKPGKNEAG